MRGFPAGFGELDWLCRRAAQEPFGAQVFINVGMTLRLCPVTGVTLPLVSYGGSSLLTSFLTLGLIFAAYRRGHLPHTPAPKG